MKLEMAFIGWVDQDIGWGFGNFLSGFRERKHGLVASVTKKADPVTKFPRLCFG